MKGTQRLAGAALIPLLTLGIGCNLLRSSGPPPGYFDLKLLEKDPTAATKDYVRRTSAHGIQRDEVLRAVTASSPYFDLEVGLLQQFRGIPLLGGSLYLRLDRGTGHVTRTLRNNWQGIGPSTSIQPILTADEARELALMAFPAASREDSRQEAPALKFLAPEYLPEIRTLYLAREVRLRNWYRLQEPPQLPEHRIVYVDAHTGEVLYISFNQVVE